MEKRTVLIVVIILLIGIICPLPTEAQIPSVDFSHGMLKVSENKRYLSHEDGFPFLWIGDTAWSLFSSLNREDADEYLSDRAYKGFTVIQAVVLTGPNAYGDITLINNDPLQPNDKFFEHVDYIVEKANELGLVIGMLPTWGSHWKSGPREPLLTPENALEYGRYLGNRYRDAQLVWILGGDSNVTNDREHEILISLAKGLREGDKGQHLITFHPRGPGLSSLYLHSEEWLDFNMSQTSHAARNHDSGLFTERDYALTPVKPTVDGEPRYETIPVGFYLNNTVDCDRFDDDDVRQAAYWSLMAGACGHTYGNNNIFQFYTPTAGREGGIGAIIPWQIALNHPGAFQMGYLRTLFESRPYNLLRPDYELVVDGPTNGGEKIRALLAIDRSFAFIYSPMGIPFTVDDSRINSELINQIWYNPRYGTSYLLHTTDTKGYQTFTPPTTGRGNDWVLILEDANKKFTLPGYHK